MIKIMKILKFLNGTEFRGEAYLNFNKNDIIVLWYFPRNINYY